MSDQQNGARNGEETKTANLPAAGRVAERALDLHAAG